MLAAAVMPLTAVMVMPAPAIPVVAMMMAVVVMAMTAMRNVVRPIHGTVIATAVHRIAGADADRIAGAATSVAAKVVITRVMGATRQKQTGDEGNIERLHDAM